jgi:hypothetical protein
VISASTLPLTNELEPNPHKTIYIFQSNSKGSICTSSLDTFFIFFHMNNFSSFYCSYAYILDISIKNQQYQFYSTKNLSRNGKTEIGRSSPELMRTRCLACAVSIKHSSTLCKETPYPSLKQKTRVYNSN